MKKQLLLTRTLVLVFALGILSGLQNTAKAETVSGSLPTSSFTLSSTNSENSSMFVRNSKPGDEFQVKVRVRNVSSKEKDFTIYGADVFPTLRGGWTYLSSKTPPRLMGTWIKESPIKSSLKKGKSQDFTFTVKVPEELENGQYIAAIVSEEFTPASVAEGSSGMSTKSDTHIRLPVQVVINVNKEKAIHSLRIGTPYHESQSNGLVTVYVPHINEGTILEKPGGTLILRDSNKKIVYQETYSMDSVYVKTTGFYDVKIPHLLVPGKYTLSWDTAYSLQILSGEYEFEVTTSDLLNAMGSADNVGAEYDVGIWGFLKQMWVWIAGVIAIIIVLIVIIILLWKRRKDKDEDSEERFKKKGLDKNV